MNQQTIDNVNRGWVLLLRHRDFPSRNQDSVLERYCKQQLKTMQLVGDGCYKCHGN